MFVLEHWIRKQWDTGLGKRHWILVFLTPLLYIASFLVYIYTKYKRQKGYAALPSTVSQATWYSVGNIAVGGTGKTPVVLALATEWLNQSPQHTVIIVSRGYKSKTTTKRAGSTPLPMLYTAQQCLQSNLGDELQEIALSLLHYPTNSCLFYQHPKRNTVYPLVEACIKTNLNNSILVLLDDAHQHFSCGRHTNILVWDWQSLLYAPLYCFPLGGFREGFGKAFFTQLFMPKTLNLDNLQKPINNPNTIHVLGKFSSINIIQYAQQQLQVAGFLPNMPHIDTLPIHFLQTQYQWHKPCIEDHTQSWTVSCEHWATMLQHLYSTLQSIEHIYIALGIAKPATFLQSLQPYIPQDIPIHTYTTQDHNPVCPIPNNILQNMNNRILVIVSKKDWVRWRSVLPQQHTVIWQEIPNLRYTNPCV
jgi:tetraacyldisaccharide-1-P 4'-kinase